MPLPWLLAVSLLLPQTSSERPKEAAYLTSRADVQVMNRQFDTAIRLYREALGVSPGYPPARKGLGRVLDLQGRHTEAQAEYQSGLQYANEFEVPALLHQLAISQIFQRRFDDAERTLRRWLDVVLAKNGGGQPMGYLDFYELALAKEDFAEAERVLETFYLPLRPPQVAADVAEPQMVLSEIQWARYEALRAVVAARAGRPDRARTLLREAETRFVAALKRLQAAAPAGMPARAIETDVDEMMFPAGEASFWLGDTARAIRAMAPMTVKLPRHDLMLGQAYEKAGDLPAARAAYRRILDSTVLSIGMAWARPIAEARLKALQP